MNKNVLKEIANYENKIAALKKKAETELNKELADLHKKFGFATRDELIDTLKSLDGVRGRKAKKAVKKTVAKKPAGRAKRTRITPELKAAVVAALKAGGKGNAVAKKFGISVPSLHNIKKEAGLVKARK